MRRSLLRTATVLVAALAALTALIAAGACGGSSSETPWPVEPDNLQKLGPAGEAPGASMDLDAGAPEKGERRPTELPPK